MIDEIKTKLVSVLHSRVKIIQMLLKCKGLRTHCRLNVCGSSKKSLFPVGHGRPLDDSSRPDVARGPDVVNHSCRVYRRMRV